MDATCRCTRSGPEDHANIDDFTPEQHEHRDIPHEAPNDPFPEADLLSHLENLCGPPADGTCDIDRCPLHATWQLRLMDTTS